MTGMDKGLLKNRYLELIQLSFSAHLRLFSANLKLQNSKSISQVLAVIHLQGVFVGKYVLIQIPLVLFSTADPICVALVDEMCLC